MTNTSPAPRKAQPETFDFPEAMRKVLDGNKVTKLEWNNPHEFIVLRGGMLQIHIGDDFSNLLVSEGDLSGVDWIVV